MARIDTRSPLKARPLRYAGQSLDENIERLINDEAMPYVAVALLAIGVALYEWFHWYSAAPPQPIPLTLLAVVVTLLAIGKFRSVRRRVRLLRLGRDGERVVGQFLEELRERGCRVFHDVASERGNVDHVVVGPKGVYVVETKTLSKPIRGEAKIEFDGEQILANGRSPDRDPIIQARAEANWLRDFLLESTGRNVLVRPVVVYPGWYIDGPSGGGRGDVWVLNPKALPAFIDQERQSLSTEDVRLLSYHLSRYVRSVTA